MNIGGSCYRLQGWLDVFGDFCEAHSSIANLMGGGGQCFHGIYDFCGLFCLVSCRCLQEGLFTFQFFHQRFGSRKEFLSKCNHEFV